MLQCCVGKAHYACKCCGKNIWGMEDSSCSRVLSPLMRPSICSDTISFQLSLLLRRLQILISSGENNTWNSFGGSIYSDILKFICVWNWPLTPDPPLISYSPSSKYSEVVFKTFSTIIIFPNKIWTWLLNIYLYKERDSLSRDSFFQCRQWNSMEHSMKTSGIMQRILAQELELQSLSCSVIQFIY